MFKPLMLAAAAVVVSAPAFAGGLTPPAPTPVVPVPVAPPIAVSADWTGLYAGGSLGYGDVTGSTTIGEDVNGLTYGLHAGYMYDLGSVVLGAELEYSMTEISDDTIGLDVDSVLRGKVRVGYDAGDFLPYVTVGAAQLTTSGAIDDSGTGYLYGIGADYQMTDSIRLGAEVLQHEFEDYAGSGIDVSATTLGVRVSFAF